MDLEKGLEKIEVILFLRESRAPRVDEARDQDGKQISLSVGEKLTLASGANTVSFRNSTYEKVPESDHAVPDGEYLAKRKIVYKKVKSY